MNFFTVRRIRVHLQKVSEDKLQKRCLKRAKTGTEAPPPFNMGNERQLLSNRATEPRTNARLAYPVQRARRIHIGAWRRWRRNVGGGLSRRGWGPVGGVTGMERD